MKRIAITLLLAGMAMPTIVGCEASGRVGDPNDTSVRTTSTNNGGSYERKTTTVREPDGDVKTKTEIRSNP